MTGGEGAYLTLAVTAFVVFSVMVLWATQRTNS